MSKISIEEVKKLAKLSKLSVSDEEAKSLQDDLESLLKYVDRLSKVDAEGLEPAAQVTSLEDVTRKDEIRDYGVDRDGLLRNAPDQEDGYIKVKRVL